MDHICVRHLIKLALQPGSLVALFLFTAAVPIGIAQPFPGPSSGGPQEDGVAALSSEFRCPEEYSSDNAKRAALQQFIKAYTARFPENNPRDLMIMRYRLLVAHSCIQTLKSMLTSVAPISEMLRFEIDDLGPKTEEYDPRTKVWTVWFRKNGEPPALSVEDLIFNFYQSPGTSPESIANAFVRPRPNIEVLGKFEAPDDLTKRPAFFIVSETLYSGQNCGYVNISKISSVGSGAYTVTLARKITGTSTADIKQKGKVWLLSAEGKADSRTLGQVSVDPSWEQYLAQKAK
jgi:hypothetical protein